MLDLMTLDISTFLAQYMCYIVLKHSTYVKSYEWTVTDLFSYQLFFWYS